MLKGRYFRRLLAVACFALCAFASILWIRSYRWHDGANICYAAGQSVKIGVQQYPAYRYVSANTSLGIVSFNVNPAYLNPIDRLKDGVNYFSTEVDDDWWWKREVKFGFAYKSWRRGHLLAVPFWFLTLLTAAAGTLLWMQRPYRFTLRGALVVTTLVAVVLGMGVAWSR